MFSLTHIYSAKKINPKYDDLFLYGAVFPDIPVTKIIEWELMQDKTEEFSRYIIKNFPELGSFAKGLLVHERPYGIDRFVHGENKNGYAYEKGLNLFDDLANLFLPKGDLIQPVLKKVFAKKIISAGHSFVEFSIEMRMVKKYPVLVKDAKRIQKVGMSVESHLAKLFSQFFEVNREKVLKDIRQYNKLLVYDITTRDKALVVFIDLIKTMRNVNLSKEDVWRILEKGISVTDDYQIYLDSIIEKCEKDYI